MIELLLVGGVCYVKIVVDVIHIFYVPKKKVFLNILLYLSISKERERERVREKVSDNIRILPLASANLLMSFFLS